MFLKYVLQAPDDGGTAGGLGNESNSTTNSGDSGGGTSGDRGQSSSTSPNVGPEWARGWEGVDSTLLGDPSLTAIKDPASLLKSYVHAQRAIGADKTILPNQNSTKEEWDTFYQKLGIPLDQQKYADGVKWEQGKSQLGDDISKEYVKLAHDLRIKPEAAQKLHDFFNTQIESKSQRDIQAKSGEYQNGLNQLQAKLGEDAYNVRLAKATTFIKENSGEDFLKFLGESGLGKNPVVVEAFMNMANKFMKEESLPGGQSSNVLTVDEMQKTVNEMLGDLKGPYHNPSHPDHTRQLDLMVNYQDKIAKARQTA